VGGKAKTLFDELARPLVSSWWTIVAGVCIGLSVGIIVTENLPTSFRATLTVQARNGARADGLRALLTRPDILARLAERDAGTPETGTLTPRQAGALHRKISVSSVSADLFEVTVQDEDPQAVTSLAERIGEIVTAPGRPFQLVAPTISVAAPAAPQSVPVCLLAVAIGLIVFVGPPLVRTAVNPVVCSEPAIREITVVPLLATIPRIKTPEVVGASLRRIKVNVGLAVLSVGTLVVVTLLTVGMKLQSVAP
jgi:hypothetical protein